MSKKYSNRWIFYWAANKTSSYIIRTVNIVCNFNRQKVKSAIKNGSYLIINALTKEYFDKQHIPRSV